MRSNWTRRSILAAGAGVAALPAMAEDSGGPRTIPTAFEENIIFATPVSTTGQTMKLLTDTGGGTFLLATATTRLGLDARAEKITAGESEMTVTPFPEFRPDAWIPNPVQGDGRMPVYPAEGEVKSFVDRGWDGMLGQAWFGNRIWTFDYPGKRLSLHATVPAPAAGAREVPLAFQRRDGRRSSHFPRIQAEIDGQTLDLLFDTGAQSPLTPAAVAAMGGTANFRGSAFITRTVFDGWRARHPDWLVVPAGEAGMGSDLIRVDNIRVAGFDTGPCWFAARADRNFTEWMSQWMDKTIVGALGGAALHHFRITADYPGSRAWFEKA